MAYDFNVDEMFEVAIRIEENGARFYRRWHNYNPSPEPGDVGKTINHGEPSQTDIRKNARPSIRPRENRHCL